MNDQGPLARVVWVELNKMLARNLDFAPGPEDLPATKAVMLEDLTRWGLTDDDAPRVQQAFQHLGARAQRFPSPAMVIRALPSRPSLKPPPMIIDDKARQGLKRFSQILREALGLPQADLDAAPTKTKEGKP